MEDNNKKTETENNGIVNEIDKLPADKQELVRHISAIGDWQQEDPASRISLVLAAEITVSSTNAHAGLMGESVKVAYALVKFAEEQPAFKNIIMLAAGALENPLNRLRLQLKATPDSPEKRESFRNLSDEIAAEISPDGEDK